MQFSSAVRVYLQPRSRIPAGVDCQKNIHFTHSYNHGNIFCPFNFEQNTLKSFEHLAIHPVSHEKSATSGHYPGNPEEREQEMSTDQPRSSSQISAARKHLSTDTAAENNEVPSGNSNSAEQPTTTEERAAISQEADVHSPVHASTVPPRKRSPEKNGELLEAAFNNDYNKLQKALNEGAEINAKTFVSEETALHLACRLSYVDIVKFLLEQNADIKTRDGDKWTPLHSAAYGDNASIAEHLVSHGILSEIDDRDWLGRTPLTIASADNNTNMVDVLLRNNACVNVSDFHHSTPLTLACESGTADTVLTLLQKGADVSAQDDDGDTPLILASRYGDIEMVKNVLKYEPDVHKARKNGVTALHRAIFNPKNEDRKKIVQMLLRSGAESTRITHDGQTPLHQASKLGYLDVVELLLDQDKVNVDAEDEDGWTALHLASLKGHADVARKLFEKGAKRKIERGGTHRSALTLYIQFLFDFEDADLESKYKAQNLERAQNIRYFAQDATDDEKESCLCRNISDKNFAGLVEAIGILPSVARDIRLVWLAKTPGMQEKIVEILEQPDVSTGSDTAPDSALQWAAFHGNHVVVWWLLKNKVANDQAEEDRSKAEKIAKKRRDKGNEMGKGKPRVGEDESQAFTPKSRERGKQRETSRPNPGSKYELTVDMLVDPPPMTGVSTEPYTITSPEEQLRQKIKDYYATIVDFYCRDGRIDLLRRTRTVDTVIYQGENVKTPKGPERVMDEARKTLGDISPGDAKEKNYTKEELRMRWVHLPANNVRAHLRK